MGRTGRAFAGLATVAVIGLICALAVTLFRGDWAKTVPVTVISDRAGLVMNPDAKVKMRGVQVGQVSDIVYKPDGTAELHLAINKADVPLIPHDVAVDITSSTVFGAKFVNLDAPPGPVANAVQPGQIIPSKHVTIEINTVFQQLVGLLDKIDPAKLNETLGAVAAAFDGRGEKFGQALVDFNSLLGKINPSLPNLSHDIQAAVPTLTAYGDASDDLVSVLRSTTKLSNTIVDQQGNLDQFLVSTIGLADVGNDVVGANRQGLTDVAHVLVPTASLLAEYHDNLRCGVGGFVPFTKGVPQYPGILLAAGITLGVERYRYPRDLPKVAASSGGASYCEALGLPEVPPNFRSPFVVGDVGANPAQYGNSGILLNSDALKQWLYGPLDGPPRNSAQVGMPG
jgi:phospholipid/cholesterol/gamma-HCH transport system substrate-binding protein